MRTRKLGKQGPELSVVGYGAWEIGGDSWGPNPGNEVINSAIAAALDAGVNWIDTAEVYGGGNSEELVRQAIKSRRDSIMIATKVAPEPIGTGFKPEQVAQACRDSLRRLGTDRIDLYQLHWWPEKGKDYPIEETWGAMDKLVTEGLVRYVGVSNFDQEHIERCLSVRHVDSLQPQFSMLHRRNEELVAWCGTKGIGVVCYGPLAFGLLTGAVDESTEFDPGDWRSGKWPDHSYYVDLFVPDRLRQHLEVVNSLASIAESLGATKAQLALAWLLERKGVTAAIAGSRSASHNRENAEAGDLSLTPEVVSKIEELLKPAPESSAD